MSEPASQITDATQGREANLIKWQKGASGNPGGRPKGIATKVRELAGGDPERLIQELMLIAEDRKNKVAERTKAIEILLDRGWGKAPSYAPIEDGDPLELDAISRYITDANDELAAAREAKASLAREP